MRIIVILLCIALSGCYTFAKYASNQEEMMSKVLNPEPDKALIYYFRSDSVPGYGQMRMYLSEQHLGDLWDNQYLYFYAYPLILYMKSESGSTDQYNIQANMTYYFEVYLDSNKKRYWKRLNKTEGINLLNKFRLTEKFNKIVVSAESPSEPLLPTDNNYLKIINQFNNVAGKDASIVYDDNEKTGIVSYKAHINNRKKVFDIIEDICNTKNVTLKAGSKLNGQSVYKTLDETYKNNRYAITFQCLY